MGAGLAQGLTIGLPVSLIIWGLIARVTLAAMTF
jgi:hypothetical protein